MNITLYFCNGSRQVIKTIVAALYFVYNSVYALAEGAGVLFLFFFFCCFFFVLFLTFLSLVYRFSSFSLSGRRPDIDWNTVSKGP